MRAFAFAVLGALLFTALPHFERAGAVAGPAFLVVITVALAVCVSGGVSPVSALSGAAGALAGGLLLGGNTGQTNSSALFALATALLVALMFAERSLRVRERRAKMMHVAASLGAGAIAGALTFAYGASASALLRGVAVTISVLVIAIPLLLEADDPVTHALDAIARDLDPETGAAETLRRAADLRRRGDTSLLDRDRDMRAHVARAWKALVLAARSRARLEHAMTTGCTPPQSVVARSDRVIAEHVTMLMRAHGAYEILQATSEALEEVERL